MAVIDAHIHLFKHGFHGDLPDGGEVARYLERRQQFGIRTALVVGYQGAERYPDNNAYIAELAVTEPWIRPLAYVPASAGRDGVETVDSALSALDRAQQRAGSASGSFVGISAYLSDEPDVSGLLEWRDPDWDRVPDPKIISINCGPHLLAGVAELARSRPECTVLLSHFAAPERPEVSIDAALSPLLAMAEIPNVHVKASGYYDLGLRGWQLAEQALLTRLVVQAFGASRVHWGSDFAPSGDHVSFATTVGFPGRGDLLADDRAEIEGAALERLLTHEPKG